MPNPTLFLEDVVDHAAARSITNNLGESKYVLGLLRWKAGLLKVRPVPSDEIPPPTLAALQRQADTLYALMVTGRA